VGGASPLLFWPSLGELPLILGLDLLSMDVCVSPMTGIVSRDSSELKTVAVFVLVSYEGCSEVRMGHRPGRTQFLKSHDKHLLYMWPNEPFPRYVF